MRCGVCLSQCLSCAQHRQRWTGVIYSAVIRIFYLVYSTNSQTVAALPLLDVWSPEAQLVYVPVKLLRQLRCRLLTVAVSKYCGRGGVSRLRKRSRRYVPRAWLASNASSQEMAARRNVDEDLSPIQTADDRRWRPPEGQARLLPTAAVRRRSLLSCPETSDLVVIAVRAATVSVHFLLVSAAVGAGRRRWLATDDSARQTMSAVSCGAAIWWWPGRPITPVTTQLLNFSEIWKLVASI